MNVKFTPCSNLFITGPRPMAAPSPARVNGGGPARESDSEGRSLLASCVEFLAF